jgi:hypothetical protein
VCIWCFLCDRKLTNSTASEALGEGDSFNIQEHSSRQSDKDDHGVIGLTEKEDAGLQCESSESDSQYGRWRLSDFGIQRILEAQTFSVQSAPHESNNDDPALDQLFESIRDAKLRSIGPGREKGGSTNAPPNDFSDNDSTISNGLDSIFSDQDSVSSASSFQSSTLQIAGRKLLADLLWQDLRLREILVVGANDDRIGPDRLERNFARVVKQFAADLEEEAESKPHRDAAKFIRRQSKRVAREIRSRLNSRRSSGKTEPRAEPLHNPPNLESESESDIDHYDDEYDLASARGFVESSFALATFFRSLKDFVCPTFSSKLGDLVGKARQHGISELEVKHIQAILTELRKVNPVDILIVDNHCPSWLDQAKTSVEDWTGEEWNWWPLQRPRRSCTERSSGVEWSCVSTILVHDSSGNSSS